jgi:Ribosomal protein L13
MDLQKGTGEVLRRAVSGMLPKNKLRRIRLERLKVFEDENAGHLMRNVPKRYDNIPIASSRVNSKENKPSGVRETQNTEDSVSVTVDTSPSFKAKVKRQDDTPALGSLGGLMPLALSSPRVKRQKVKKRKLPRALMRVFDADGREVWSPGRLRRVKQGLMQPVKTAAGGVLVPKE